MRLVTALLIGVDLADDKVQHIGFLNDVLFSAAKDFIMGAFSKKRIQCLFKELKGAVKGFFFVAVRIGRLQRFLCFFQQFVFFLKEPLVKGNLKMLVFYINWDRALAKGKSTHCLLPHFHYSGLRGHGCGCSAQFGTLKFSGTGCFYFYKLALLFG